MGSMMITDPSAVIRGMQPSDWSMVRSIYAAGIAGGNASFETKHSKEYPCTYRFSTSDP